MESEFPKEVFDDISLYKIKMLAELERPGECEHEIFSEVYSLPVGVFWTRFLSDKADFSCRDFYAEEGHQDIVLNNWEPDYIHGNVILNYFVRIFYYSSLGGKKDDISPEMDNILDTRTRKLTRTLSMKVKVKGVPFITTSNCNSTYY